MNEPYTIETIKKSGNDLTAYVSVNWDAEVFKGHFPEAPLFPGALLIKVSTEALRKACGHDSHFEIRDYKFLKPITNEYGQLILNFELKDGHYIIICKDSKMGSVIFKGKLLPSE